MKIRNFRINGMFHPLGTDEKPRFSWYLESEKTDVVQTAYRMTISDQIDTGWVKSEA